MFRHLIACVGFALALSACALTEAPRPAPLESTVIDEKAVALAAQTVDALALTATALVKTGAIKPGSARALALADALDMARDGVNAAAAARMAGSANSYGTAIARAQDAMALIKQIVEGV